MVVGSCSQIKALLLDQSFAAGVGNWIADEVLFQAKVHPASRCGNLDDTQLRDIHSSLRDVRALQVTCHSAPPILTVR